MHAIALLVLGALFSTGAALPTEFEGQSHDEAVAALTRALERIEANAAFDAGEAARTAGQDRADAQQVEIQSEGEPPAWVEDVKANGGPPAWVEDVKADGGPPAWVADLSGRP